MASIDGRNETIEGIDKKLALHYYGRIEFIRSLLPLMRKSAESGEYVRAMSILSAGVHSPYTHLDDLELKHNFSLANAATAAGVYNDLAMDRLAADNPALTFIHAAPGMVRTSWGTELPFILRAGVRLLQRVIARSPETCAAAMCRALLEDSLRGGFRLITQDAGTAAPTAAHGAAVRDRVWAHTMEVLDRCAAAESSSPAGGK